MGPQEQRLMNHLKGADSAAVSDHGAAEWTKCANLLARVATAVRTAADKANPLFGAESGVGLSGRTSEQMVSAFQRTADATDKKVAELQRGATALTDASNAINGGDATLGFMNLMAPAMADPGAKKTLSPDDAQDTQKANQVAQHNSQVDAYAANVAARERMAKVGADAMDESFEQSTATMKNISGYQDPPPAPGSAGAPTTPTSATTPWTSDTGSGTSHGGDHGGHITKIGPGKGGGGDESGGLTPGTPQGPTTTGNPGSGGTSGSGGTGGTGPGTGTPGTPGTPGLPGVGGPGAGMPPGTPAGTSPAASSGGPSVPINPGTLGVGGAVLGAGALAGMLRGSGGSLGLSSLSGGTLSGSAVRPIGTTAMPGTGSVLGRGSALAGESEGSLAGRGAGGASSGGVQSGGARSGGVGSGGRGGAGGRAGGGGGRGGKKNKRGKAGDRDLFDDGQDWLDDEGASPEVLS